MKMDNIARIKEFLFDPTQREITLKEYSCNEIFVKRHLADGLDELYTSSDYGFWGEKRLDFAGLIHYAGHVVYDLCWALRDQINDKAKMSDLFDSVAEQVEQEVLRRYAAGDLPEPTSDSAKPTYDIAYFRDHMLEGKVWEYYVTCGNGPWWVHNEQYIKTDLQKLYIDCIINRSNAIAVATADYMNHYAHWLRLFKEEDTLCDARLAELEVTPGRHRYQRAIRSSIGDENKVWIDVVKDGFAFTGQIEAWVLTLSGNNEYYLHYMPGKDEKRYCTQFGGYDAHLYPEDIVAIRHGRRTLYNKADIDAQEESK